MENTADAAVLLCQLHPPGKDFKKQAAKKGAINKRDAGNATKAGELGILCFLLPPANQP